METAKNENVEKSSDEMSVENTGIYVVRTFGSSDLLDLFADYIALKIGAANADDWNHEYGTVDIGTASVV